MPSNAHAILDWSSPNPRGKHSKKPLTARQARKTNAATREKNYTFYPVLSQPHKNGPRRSRRAFFPSLKGKGVVGGRRKAQEWGAYAGKKIERLVRAMAPKHVVDAMRVEVRDFLRSQLYKRG